MINALKLHRTLTVSIVLVLGMVLWSCENPNTPPYPNTPPETRLANVPADDTIGIYISQGTIPEQTLFWVGDDGDGFIVAYKYRWLNYHSTGPESTQWNTILNLTSMSGFPLDTLIQVSPSAASIARIYNYFSTLNANDNTLLNRLDDSLASGHYFAVPYPTGPVPGDSVKGADPIQIEAPNKGNFIFNSPADSNLHRFEVKSVDNVDVEDPTPAHVSFWTLPSPGLIVRFTTGPTPSQGAFLVLRCATEKNPGLRFTFGAIDPSTFQRDYSWSIDDTLHWSPWSRDAFATITAGYFQVTGSDTHTIYMRGRNRWGVISPIVSQRFRAQVPAIDDPAWPHRTLFINNTRYTGVGGVDSLQSMGFYREVLDSCGKSDSMDVWLVRSGSTGFPSRVQLATYTSIVVAADVRISTFNGAAVFQISGDRRGRLQDYLNAGGKMIFSGSPDIRFMISGYDAWATNYLHYQDNGFMNTTLDFGGSIGRLGYPDIRLDSTKVTGDSLYAIRMISIGYPRGFGETISLFNSISDHPAFENQPLGVRYKGPFISPECRSIYSVVHFAIPLYFANKSDVIQSMKKAFIDINENSIP